MGRCGAGVALVTEPVPARHGGMRPEPTLGASDRGGRLYPSGRVPPTPLDREGATVLGMRGLHVTTSQSSHPSPG